MGKNIVLLGFPCGETFLIVTDVESCLDEVANRAGDGNEFIEEVVCFITESKGSGLRVIISSERLLIETVGC